MYLLLFVFRIVIKVMKKERIRINVGGMYYETYRNTLERYPDTLLGCPNKRKYYYNKEKQEYFFNRSRQVFDSVLFYYQSNGILSKPTDVPERIFLEELKFFRIGSESDHRSFGEKIDRVILGEEISLPKNRLQRNIWLLLCRPSSSVIAKSIEIFSMIALLLTIVTSCLETESSFMDSVKDTNVEKIFYISDHVCYGWFAMEYIAKLLLVREKINYLRSWLSVIDLLAIIPFYLQVILKSSHYFMAKLSTLRVLRLLRVARILKITRYNRGMRALLYTIHASSHELSLYLSIALFLNIFISSLMFYFEQDVPGTLIESIPQAMWWSINTFTTVGYGDAYPFTLPGKILGCFCSMLGIIFLGVPVYCFVTNFLILWESIKANETDNIASKVRNSLRRLRYGWTNQSKKFRSSLRKRRIVSRLRGY